MGNENTFLAHMHILECKNSHKPGSKCNYYMYLSIILDIVLGESSFKITSIYLASFLLV